MSTILAKINAAPSLDLTGSPAARMAVSCLDRISAISRRAHGGRGRFSAVTCGSATARRVQDLVAMIPDIKAAGLRD